MTIVLAALLIAAILLFTLFIRPEDIPDPAAGFSASSIWKTAKQPSTITCAIFNSNTAWASSSDNDYQRTKIALQKELAGVLSEIEETVRKLGLATRRAAPPSKRQAQTGSSKPQNTCPHCGATFSRAMRFCGECGKAMTA